jgi:hypothetical protein
VSVKTRLWDTLITLAIGGDTRAAALIVNTERGSFEFDVKSEIIDRIEAIERRLEEVKDVQR